MYALDSEGGYGGRIYTFEQNNGDYQKWIFQHLDGDDYSIIHQKSNCALDANDDDDVYTFEYNRGRYQIWTITQNSDKSVRIAHKATGKVLDSEGGHDGDVYKLNWNEGDYQRWYVPEEYKDGRPVWIRHAHGRLASGVYWCARDLSSSPLGNHHLLLIVDNDGILEPVPLQTERDKKLEREAGVSFLTVAGARKPSELNDLLIHSFNDKDDVFAIRESLNPPAYVSFWKPDFDLEIHLVSTSHDKIRQVVQLADLYKQNTSGGPPRYTLMRDNCSAWVHTLLIVAGLGDDEVLGEFWGIDWGEEDEIAKSWFFPFVFVFEGENFEGTPYRLALGLYEYNRGIAQFKNDAINSVRVPSGYRITLYQDAHGTGKPLVLTKDEAKLYDRYFSNTASSILVEKA